jgi:hypothetical protein
MYAKAPISPRKLVDPFVDGDGYRRHPKKKTKIKKETALETSREPSISKGIKVPWGRITDAVREQELYDRRKYRIVPKKGGKFRRVHACVGCAIAKHPCLIIFTRSTRSMEVGNMSDLTPTMCEHVCSTA